MVTRCLLLVLASVVFTIAQAQDPPAAKPAPIPIRFMSYDVNPKKPNDVTIGIHVNGRTHFNSLGDEIRGTNYKIRSFEKKETVKPDGTKADASEITVLDTKTNKTTVIPISGVVEGARPL